ncbi:hypothetical protein HNP33_003083 [Comamonas odontotermitis]|uniref:Uncharacterized protein n=1 Tax=Comamonas odontotermitis TaxID=379895 RepID=A0ABR6RIJ3_9BURK|nr:hypothetical protein [Comamonas odontotermitis]
MIRLIRFLITGDWHLHQWGEPVVTGTYAGMTGRTISGAYHVVRCKHCGKYKKFNF